MTISTPTTPGCARWVSTKSSVAAPSGVTTFATSDVRPLVAATNRTTRCAQSLRDVGDVAGRHGDPQHDVARTGERLGVDVGLEVEHPLVEETTAPTRHRAGIDTHALRERPVAHAPVVGEGSQEGAVDVVERA